MGGKCFVLLMYCTWNAAGLALPASFSFSFSFSFPLDFGSLSLVSAAVPSAGAPFSFFGFFSFLGFSFFSLTGFGGFGVEPPLQQLLSVYSKNFIIYLVHTSFTTLSNYHLVSYIFLLFLVNIHHFKEQCKSFYIFFYAFAE